MSDATAGESTPPTSTKRKAFRAVGIVLAIAALVLGLWFYLSGRAYETTDNAFIEGHIIQISPKVSGYVARVHVTDNQHVRKGDLLVEIDARDYQSRLQQARAVLASATGRHKTAEINVTLTKLTSGANVQQASAGLEQAKSGVRSREAAVGSLRGQVVRSRQAVITAQNNVAQARAQVAIAEAEFTRASADVKRYQQLIERDEVSRQAFDNAMATARTAAARLESSRAALVAAESQTVELQAAQRASEETLRQAESQVAEGQAQVGEAVGRFTQASAAPQQVAVSQSQAETANADLEQARAQVEQAELDLSYTKIYAPEDGRVTKKLVEAGGLLQVGVALMSIVPDNVWVVANFKETQLARMRPGQPVEIRVDAYPEKRFRGKVESIQAGSGSRFSVLPPENATGNFVKVVQRVPVKITFVDPPDASRPLGPGMSVQPEVKVQ